MLKNKIHWTLILLVIFVLPLFTINLHAQTDALLPEGLIKEIINEVSGDRAWWHVNALAQYHRIEKSKDYHKAAEYIVKQAESIGLKKIQI